MVRVYPSFLLRCCDDVCVILATVSSLALMCVCAVKIKRSFPKQSLKYKRYVTVLPVFDAQVAAKGSKPVTHQAAEHYRFTGAGSVSASLWMPRSAYLLGEDIGVHFAVENSANKPLSAALITLREELVTEGKEAETEAQARKAVLFTATQEYELDHVKGNWSRVMRLPAHKWCRPQGAVKPSMLATCDSTMSRQHTLLVCLKIARSAYVWFYY